MKIEETIFGSATWRIREMNEHLEDVDADDIGDGILRNVTNENEGRKIFWIRQYTLTTYQARR